MPTDKILLLVRLH